MAKQPSRNSQRIDSLTDEITNNVLKNEDFLRHVKETALQTGLPEDAVKLVLSDFFLRVPKIMYSDADINKRVSFYGFFNLEIKKRVYNLINKSNEHKQ